jgi:hypothetical protein
MPAAPIFRSGLAFSTAKSRVRRGWLGKRKRLKARFALTPLAVSKPTDPGDPDGLRRFRDLPWTPNRRVGDLRNVAFVGNYNGIEFDNRMSLRDHI